MPWSKSNLPPAAKSLKGHDVEIFIAVANSTLKQTGDDGKAVMAGLAAVKKFHTKGTMATKADFAYTPSDNTSEWKLNISDARHTAAAVAALGKGFRGKKVSIPSEDLPAVKRKVAAAYHKFFPDNDTPPILKSLDVKINDQEVVDSALFGTIISAIAGFFRNKEYNDQWIGQCEEYAEEQLEAAGLSDPNEADEADETPVQVVKALNADLRQATYVVLEPDAVDLHQDTYTAEDVSKACHNFWAFCQKAYLDHNAETEAATIVENYISPVDMKIGDKLVQKGTWLQVWQFDETLWTSVKDGTYTGVSIGAYAKQEEL